MNVKIIFDAVDIIDGIKDSFSVHVSMEEDVFSARVVNLEPSPEMLNGKADAIINTASGEIASFPDGADGVPMKSLVVSMQPIQSLNGYAHPWPAGGGANQWDEEWERGTIGVTTGAKVDDNTKIRSKNYVPISPNTAYYYKFPGNWRMVYFDSDKNVVERGNTYSPNIILTSPATAHYLLFALDATTEYDNNIAINYPSTVTTYSPYSNICPISGRTGLSVYRTGKNLYSRENSEYNVPYYNQDGTQTQYEDVAVWWFKAKPNTKYTCSLKEAPSSLTYFRWINCDTDKGFISRPASVYGSNQFPITITTPADTGWVQAAVNEYNAAQVASNDWQIQIEEGQTATAYEAFGNTYSVDWTSQAGTVYGGTLDVVTGLLTVDRANIPSYNGETINEPWLSSMDEYAPGATPTTGAQVVYELATPITYQLTAQEVETLKGQNHVWSDAGDVDLTYVADTKLYIDNKIAQAIAAALNA